jgi:hypothetical protein
MADAMTGPITPCPWCSALLTDPGAEQCPTCGAILVPAPDAPGEIRGVTTLDPEAILRARSEMNRPRNNRLLSFITGETEVEADVEASATSLARPGDAVRRELLRLQFEAEAADLQAESVALKADELARRGVHLSELGEPPALEGADERAPDEPAEAPPGEAPRTEAPPAG